MIEFLQAHAVTILSAILAAKALATLIVNLTPTPRDDELLGKFYTWIEVFAGIVTRRAKDVPGESFLREAHERAMAEAASEAERFQASLDFDFGHDKDRTP